MTNSIKFTPAGGEVSVHLKVIPQNYASESSINKPMQKDTKLSLDSAPDKDVLEDVKV